LPVGRREGLHTKLTITGQTGKALDMGRRGAASVESSSDVAPTAPLWVEI
jgi:hypothetical protein